VVLFQAKLVELISITVFSLLVMETIPNTEITGFLRTPGVQVGEKKVSSE
jgi:hypothetical protein